MSVHTRKISRLLTTDTNIDEHIKNIFSYRLRFCQKLVLSRGLNFTLPQRTLSREIHATFETAYWKLEPKLNDSGKRELAAAPMRIRIQNMDHPYGPGPWTTPLDPVHGLPLWTTPVDHPCGPPLILLSYTHKNL